MFNLSIDRWTISNATLTYQQTITMEKKESNDLPFLLPMTDVTSQEFRAAATDLHEFKSNIDINLLIQEIDFSTFFLNCWY